MLPDLPQRYLLSMERSDWSTLLTDWRRLVPADSIPWLLSKFGELFVCQADGKIGMLQVSAFQYQVVAEHKIDFQEWLADPEKMSEWFLAPLVDRLEAGGKMLGAGQCYSFITPLGLGGALSEANVMLIPIHEHFGAWGSVFRQIADLPDGAKVRLTLSD